MGWCLGTAVLGSNCEVQTALGLVAAINAAVTLVINECNRKAYSSEGYVRCARLIVKKLLSRRNNLRDGFLDDDDDDELEISLFFWQLIRGGLAAILLTWQREDFLATDESCEYLVGQLADEVEQMSKKKSSNGNDQPSTPGQHHLWVRNQRHGLP